MKAIRQRFFMQVQLISEPEDFKINSHLLDVIPEEHFEDYLNCLKYGLKIKPAFKALDKTIELSQKLHIDTYGVLVLISQFSLLNSIFNSKGCY